MASDITVVKLTLDVLPRSGHVAAVSENYMIVWGGYKEDDYGGDRYIPNSQVNIYHADFKYWTRQETDGEYPPGTSGAEAYLYQGSLYVFGGHTAEGNTNDLYQLDLRSFKWTRLKCTDSACPSPRDKFASWISENRLYCFGGFGVPVEEGTGCENGYFVADTSNPWGVVRGWNNHVWYFDLSSRKWTNPRCRGPVPLPRAAHRAVKFDSKVFIFGGRHDQQRMNDLHCLDLDTDTWSGEIYIEGALPCGRSWHSFTEISKTAAFLYGGYSTNNAPLSDGWVLDVALMQWTQLTLARDKPRLWHTACYTKNGDVLVFGGCSNDILHYVPNIHCNDVLEFQIQPYSLSRLCLESAYKNKDVTQHAWNLLPLQLRDWLEKKEHLSEDKTRSLPRTVHVLNGSTCCVS